MRVWNIKKKKKKINEQSKPKQTYRYREQSGGYWMRQGKISKGYQLCGDVWKLNFR